MGSAGGRGVSWGQLCIAVIGGDEREPEIARLAATTGATVRGFGFPWPEGGVPGVSLENTAEAAAKGAHYCLFPIPLSTDDVLYAPHAEEPIRANEQLLGALAPAAHVFLGRVTPAVRAVA